MKQISESSNRFTEDICVYIASSEVHVNLEKIAPKQIGNGKIGIDGKIQHFDTSQREVCLDFLPREFKI